VVSVTSTHRIANSDEEVARSSLSELKIRRTGPSWGSFIGQTVQDF
jgi:hypothetical protein